MWSTDISLWLIILSNSLNVSYAALEGKSARVLPRYYWLPKYDFSDKFRYEFLSKGTLTRVQLESLEKGPKGKTSVGCRFAFFLKPAVTPPRKELLNIEKVKQRFRIDRGADEKFQTMQSAFYHVLNQSLGGEDLEAWTHQLSSMVDLEEWGWAMGAKIHVLYGLKSLQLQYFETPELADHIKPHLEFVTQRLLEESEAAKMEDSAWIKEILRPNGGLSKEMREDWGLFDQMIWDDANLRNLRMAISKLQPVDVIWQKFDVLEKIFQNTSAYSSQTRLAAIGLMNHIMRKEPELREYITQIIDSIFEKNNYLLEHEEIILKGMGKLSMKASLRGSGLD